LRRTVYEGGKRREGKRAGKGCNCKGGSGNVEEREFRAGSATKWYRGGKLAWRVATKARHHSNNGHDTELLGTAGAAPSRNRMFPRQ
jgi:hypothetical protein